MAVFALARMRVQVDKRRLRHFVSLDQHGVAFGAVRVDEVRTHAAGHVADVHIAQVGLAGDVSNSPQGLTACGRDVLHVKVRERGRG